MKDFSTVNLQNNDDLAAAFRLLVEQYHQKGIPLGKIRSISKDEKWCYTKLENGTESKAFCFGGEHSVYGDLTRDFEPKWCDHFSGREAASALTELLETKGILGRAFLLSALNALSAAIYDPEEYRPYDRIDDYVKPDSTVTLIGFGPQSVERLCGTVKKLYVSDMRDREILLAQLSPRERSCPSFELCDPSRNEKILRESDVVSFSGCTIVNKTYLEILRWSRNATVCAIGGPSAGLLPEYLFSLGITHISSGSLLPFSWGEAYQILSPEF